MKVNAVKCPSCGDIIYSVARHDFHSCTCTQTSVDGGFDYFRYLFKSKPEVLEIEVDATKEELFQDWNRSLKHPRKYGTIRCT